MIVVVPTPRLDCPALNALKMEGVSDLHAVLCERPTDYGRAFAEYWSRGEAFIVVEWDICPWPGAIDKLAGCKAGWCSHAYPLTQGNIAKSFGIGKYRPQGLPPDNWQHTEWQQLDGQVIPVLRKLYKRPCEHSPPVAHARERIAA